MARWEDEASLKRYVHASMASIVLLAAAQCWGQDLGRANAVREEVRVYEAERRVLQSRLLQCFDSLQLARGEAQQLRAGLEIAPQQPTPGRSPKPSPTQDGDGEGEVELVPRAEMPAQSRPIVTSVKKMLLELGI